MNKYSIINLLNMLLIAVIFELTTIIIPSVAYANPYSGGSTNCTWVAWQLAHDRYGIDLPGWHDAGTWYDSAAGIYERGTVPMSGSLAVWGTNSNNQWGHVALVVEVSGDKMLVHEGGVFSTGNKSAGWYQYHEAWVPTSGPEYGYAYGGERIGFIYLNPSCLNRPPADNVELAIGGDGTITLVGWAFDPDDPAKSIDIHAYVGGPAGDPNAEFHGFVADDGGEDVNAAFSITGAHRYDVTFATNLRGDVPVYIYGIDTSGGNNPCFGNWTVTVLESKRNAVTTLPEGRYAFWSKGAPGKAMDVVNSSMEDMGNIALKDYSTGDNQKYDVRKNNDGSYSFIAVHSGKAVEVTGASIANAANISQFLANGAPAQRWWAIENDDGTWSFKHRVSGHALDFVGDNVSQHIYLSTNDNQHWYLVPTDASKWKVEVKEGAQAPGVTVVAGGVTLTEGRDYEVSINKKKGVLQISAKGSFTGKAEVEYSTELPSALNEIETEAFAFDVSLRNVTLPSGVTAIGSRAFAGAELSTIDIPASVTEISDDTFEGVTVPMLIRAEPDSVAVHYALRHDLDFRANTKMRALVVGQTDYPDADKIDGSSKDMAKILGILEGYSTTTMTNLVAEEILDAIDAVFCDATDEDISLFYYRACQRITWRNRVAAHSARDKGLTPPSPEPTLVRVRLRRGRRPGHGPGRCDEGEDP